MIDFYSDERGCLFLRYIGSKVNLIEKIDNFIQQNTLGNEQVFLDLFAGSNAVAQHFKRKYTVYTNDILYFSYVLAKANIENNEPLTFDLLKQNGIDNPLDYLQNVSVNDLPVGYYERAYSPTGEKMYFTVENAKRIDFVRDTIEKWKGQKLITETEYFYLVSALIEAIPFISNTTGTYGAFLKHWDKRALKPLTLIPLNVTNNKRQNKSFNEDSNDLVKSISADIVYIDPPYNKRQYASNYHVLENIACHNKPELKGITSLFDYKLLKSDYSNQKKAYDALDNLLHNIDATHVILSYNNEGIIPEDKLILLMKKHAIDGNTIIEKIPYRKYKSKITSKSYELYELLLYIRKKELDLPKVKSNSEQLSLLPTSDWKLEHKNFIKSPLNYIGGKFKLLPQIIPLFPPNIHNFVDVFSGGANVGINVKAKHHHFNDMNYHVNEMFRYFAKQNIDVLIKNIESKISKYNLSKTNEEGYLKFRKQYNINQNPLDLYILISYSYNYQIRFNNSMEFNNPFGRNRSQFSDNMRKNLIQFVQRLNEIHANFTDEYFTNLDFSHLVEGDFVYLDPPYLITTGSYNDGNRGFQNWGEQQEKYMYKLMQELTKQNVRYALSNVIDHKGKSNELLKSFIADNNVHVHYLDYNYNNASYNTKKDGSTEVLITNYDPYTFGVLK